MIIPVRCFTCGKIIAINTTHIRILLLKIVNHGMPNEDTILKVSRDKVPETPEGKGS